MSDKCLVINYLRYYITVGLFFGAKMHQSPSLLIQWKKQGQKRGVLEEHFFLQAKFYKLLLRLSFMTENSNGNLYNFLDRLSYEDKLRAHFYLTRHVFEDKKTFSTWLTDKLKERGIKQKDLARLLLNSSSRTSSSYVLAHNYLNAKTFPLSQNLEKILELFGLTK